MMSTRALAKVRSHLSATFPRHYGIPAPTLTDVILSTSRTAFSIDDNFRTKKLILLSDLSGTAKFRNSKSECCILVNFDLYISNTPHYFQDGKKRCDVVIVNASGGIVLFGEIKDKKDVSKAGREAVVQLESSVKLVNNVPELKKCIDSNQTKVCAYFNSAPRNYMAAPFNRLSLVINSGFKMPKSRINALGFEYWEFVGNQVMDI